MSELDRERREMAAGTATARGPSRRVAPDYTAHFHPPIMLDRRGDSRSDFRMVATLEHH